MAKKKKPTSPVPAWFKHSRWVIPLMAILVYIPSFNADFTLDDVLIVEENTYLRSLNKIPDIWTSHYWAGKIDATDTGLYRPLTLTTYNLQYAMTGDKTGPFHILNILLHALVCFVLMKTTNLVFKDYRLTVLTGIWYAIHPIHTEAVAGIVGRAEILAALFILTSTISYHQWRLKGQIKWLWALLLSTFAAITSKEHGFMIPALLMLQETYYFFISKKYSWGERRMWIAFGSVVLLSLVAWMYRATITGPSVGHELWATVDAAERMATSVRTTAEYIGMHLWPMGLSADYWTDEVPIVGFGHLQVLLSIFVLLGLIGLCFYLRRKMPHVAWGILFFFLTLLPVSNFLFAAGFLKAERILYIPSIGLIVALMGLLLKLMDLKKGKIPGLVLFGASVLFFSGLTWMRAGDWKNNFTLAKATLKTSPNSPRFNNMMGLELRAQKKNEKALFYFEKSVQSNPKHVPALVNLGTEYRNIGRLQEAAATLERALDLDPNTLATYVNLMTVYRSMEDYDKNVSVAEKALKRFPQSAPVIWNAANAYQLKGNMAKANELRAKAKEIDPNISVGK